MSDLEPQAAPRTPRAAIGFVSFLVLILSSTAALTLPTGFVVRSPGPTEDTLGTSRVTVDGASKDVPMVAISGAYTYPTTGHLLLTTVSVSGGPVSNVFALDVLRGWAMSSQAVLPSESVFPVGVTREQQQQETAAQMTSSQEMATAAALTELGYDLTPILKIAGFSEGSHAKAVVQEGDIIASLNGTPVQNHAELLALLGAIEPGAEVTLGVDRDGTPASATFRTGEATNADGTTRASLGVLVQTSYTFPFDVTIRIDDIGGPSAGTMFALAIIDRLTPEDEAAGHTIAGTGTIDAAGTVGPIGGIVQKMYGAYRDGARWFLAPGANCGEAAGHGPVGLRIVQINTLSEARAAITAIGNGTGDTLPTCS